MKEQLPNLDPKEWPPLESDNMTWQPMDFDNITWPPLDFDFSEDLEKLPPLNFDLFEEFNDPWFDETTITDGNTTAEPDPRG